MTRRATPSQTVGPFFSIGFSWLERTDLTEGIVDGPRVTVRGRVLDGDGQPVPDAVLEIWQADAHGRYRPETDRGPTAPASFLGFGRVPVSDAGEFCFTTIKPGRVDGANGLQQAPHLAISIFMRGLLKRLVTRVYFPDEPSNNSDPVFGSVPIARRPTLLARAVDAEGKNLLWDVHLQGDHETVFFDC